MSIFYNPSIVTDGLVLCLDANNKKSYPGTGTVWKDLSLNKNDCILINGPTFTPTGISSINFDGVDDYASIVIPSLPTCNTITVEGFIKWNALVAGMFFGLTSYDVWTNSGALGYNNSVSNVVGISASKVTELNLIGTYKHYAFIMNSSGLLSSNKIYIDGVPYPISVQVALDGNIPGLGSTLILSGWTNNISFKNNISYGNLHVYTRELTVEEINKNFNAHKQHYNYV